MSQQALQAREKNATAERTRLIRTALVTRIRNGGRCPEEEPAADDASLEADLMRGLAGLERCEYEPTAQSLSRWLREDSSGDAPYISSIYRVLNAIQENQGVAQDVVEACRGDSGL